MRAKKKRDLRSSIFSVLELDGKAHSLPAFFCRLKEMSLVNLPLSAPQDMGEIAAFGSFSYRCF
ncbi:hypothetical protein [Pseudomonas laurentiana]